MIKNIFRSFFSLLVVFGLSSLTYALDIYVPKTNFKSTDYKAQSEIITLQDGGETYLQAFVNLINDYGMFLVGFILLVLFVYAGFKIVTAEGDKEQIKKGYHLIIAGFIVIFVVLLSYAIVQLLVNLF